MAAENPSRKYLIITLCVFAIPFFGALLMHTTGWYKFRGTTNHGTLIIPPVAMSDITNTSTDSRWWMVYVMPEQCTDACKNSLYQMRQVHSALGPDQKRVARMVLTTQPLSEDYQALITKEFPNTEVQQISPQKLQQAFSASRDALLQHQQSGQIYLVDTMGAVFMYYPSYEDEQQSILKGRDLLQDLRKVLKLSKIG